MNLRTTGVVVIATCWWCPAIAWIGVGLIILGILLGHEQP